MLGSTEGVYFPRPEPKFKRKLPLLRKRPPPPITYRAAQGPYLTAPPPLPPPPPLPVPATPLPAPAPEVVSASRYGADPALDFQAPGLFPGSIYNNLPFSSAQLGFPSYTGSTETSYPGDEYRWPLPYLVHTGPAPHLFRPSPIEYGGWKPTYGPYGPAVPSYPFSDYFPGRPGNVLRMLCLHL